MNKLLKPQINQGEYVFVLIDEIDKINQDNILCSFKENGKYSLIVEKEYADKHNLSYDFIAAWISLGLNSSLDSVGLTSKFSRAHEKKKISCNVIAGYNNDHIFVDLNDDQFCIDLAAKNMDSMIRILKPKGVITAQVGSQDKKPKQVDSWLNVFNHHFGNTKLSRVYIPSFDCSWNFSSSINH